MNKLEGRTGSLWDGRYKLSPIETDEYLLHCSRYVERNPVKAKMVERPEDYVWSSYRAKTGLAQCPILDFDPCYLGFSEPKHDYAEFVNAGEDSQTQEFIRSRLSRNQLTGSEKFVD